MRNDIWKLVLILVGLLVVGYIDAQDQKCEWEPAQCVQVPTQGC